MMEARGIVGPPRGSDPREISSISTGEIPSNEPPTTAMRRPATPSRQTR